MSPRCLVAGLLLGLAFARGREVSAQAAIPGEEPLGWRISVRFDREELGSALARLRTVFGLPLAFSLEALPREHRVSLAAENEPVRQVLASLLEGTGLRLVATGGGTLVIAPGDPTGAEPLPARAVTDLATGVQQLDQIVVMGTPVAGAPEREQPNAVSVVHGDDLLAYRYSRTADLIRAVLPGIVLWDRGPSGPPAEIAAVRGASSFTARGIKTYVDGVELASPGLFTLIDPRSIERIEVIRGPQGAALYGSDAINGIIHIVTRKGRIGESSRVRGWASASAGPFDREALPSTIVRQDYAGSMEWGGPLSSLQIDGKLDRVGSAQSAPNTRGFGLHGGGQVGLGRLLLSGTARVNQLNFREESATVALPLDLADTERSARVEAATLSLTAVHQTTDRWIQTLVVGYDRASGALGTLRSPLATVRQPLAATHETASKTSVRMSSVLDLDVGPGASLTSTVGFEHSALARNRGWSATGDVVSLYEDDVRNTGTFAQGKLRVGSFAASAGARVEWSSSFGPDYGAALASSVGASWTEPVGTATLRLRAGWGRGIRPPEPGMSRGMTSARFRQEPNLDLAPEVQTGFEVGADLFAGQGSFVRLTAFDQRATDLILSVFSASVRGGPQVYQYQNVGAIRNRGLEIEAGARAGRFAADLLVHVTDSKIERLSPTYRGSLRVGDELPEIPGAAGAASMSWAVGPARLALGTTFVGSWTGYDLTALAAAAASADEPRPPIHQYLRRYPAVFKPYVATTVDLTREIGAFLVVDNLTNTARFERHNGNPPAGRSVLVGIEVKP